MNSCQQLLNHGNLPDQTINSPSPQLNIRTQTGCDLFTTVLRRGRNDELHAFINQFQETQQISFKQNLWMFSATHIERIVEKPIVHKHGMKTPWKNDLNSIKKVPLLLKIEMRFLRPRVTSTTVHVVFLKMNAHKQKASYNSWDFDARHSWASYSLATPHLPSCINLIRLFKVPKPGASTTNYEDDIS